MLHMSHADKIVMLEALAPVWRDGQKIGFPHAVVKQEA